MLGPGCKRSGPYPIPTERSDQNQNCFSKRKLGSLSGEEAGEKNQEARMGSRWEWGPEPRQGEDGAERARLGGFRQWTPGMIMEHKPAICKLCSSKHTAFVSVFWSYLPFINKNMLHSFVAWKFQCLRYQTTKQVWLTPILKKLRTNWFPVFKKYYSLFYSSFSRDVFSTDNHDTSGCSNSLK